MVGRANITKCILIESPLQIVLSLGRKNQFIKRRNDCVSEEYDLHIKIKPAI